MYQIIIKWTDRKHFYNIDVVLCRTQNSVTAMEATDKII